MNPLFRVHKLNDDGMAKAQELAAGFERLHDLVKSYGLDGREMSLFKTYLEIASMYAKKAMAQNPQHQLSDEQQLVRVPYTRDLVTLAELKERAKAEEE